MQSSDPSESVFCEGVSVTTADRNVRVLHLALAIVAATVLGHGTARAAGAKYYLYDSAGVRVAVLDGMVSAPGVVFTFAGPECPAGSLAANGSTVAIAAYPELYTAIKTFHGGDGVTTFQLPDLRGTFVRGAPGSVVATSVNVSTEEITAPGHALQRAGFPVRFTTTGTLPGGLTTNTTYWAILVNASVVKVASTEANARAGTAVNLTSTGSGTITLVPWVDPGPRTSPSTGSGSNDVGSLEADALQGHWHDGGSGAGYGVTPVSTWINPTAGGGDPSRVNGWNPRTDGTNGAPRTASETRPRNVALLYCIQY
jgi:microcystin-dependent protein